MQNKRGNHQQGLHMAIDALHAVYDEKFHYISKKDIAYDFETDTMKGYINFLACPFFSVQNMKGVFNSLEGLCAYNQLMVVMSMISHSYDKKSELIDLEALQTKWFPLLGNFVLKSIDSKLNRAIFPDESELVPFVLQKIEKPEGSKKKGRTEYLVRATMGPKQNFIYEGDVILLSENLHAPKM